MVDAREFFDAARAATLDAQRCKQALDAAERDAYRLGGGLTVGSVSGTRDTDRIALGVGHVMQQEERLAERMRRDYALIDLANAVLYGTDRLDGAADLIRRGWWADAAYHYYLARRTWPYVAKLLGHAEVSCRRASRAVFDVIDTHNLIALHARRPDAGGGWSLAVG